MNPLIKEHNLKLFRIESLFGDRNVEIPFDNSFKILIGENGIGKTSILNAIYYTLTGNFSKLNALIFSKIIVEFNSGKKVELNKSDLTVSEDEERLRGRQEVRMVETISQFLTEEEKELLSKKIVNEEFTNLKEIQHIINNISKHTPLPANYIKRALITMFSGKLVKIEEARRIILKEVDSEILYFPTYRRIEEELHKLGALQEIKMPHDDKRLIQFGMEDVSLTFKRVIENIKNSAIFGFTEITGEMLSQYLEGPPKLDRDIREKIKPDILKIILERVGENITVSNKSKILKLVESSEIFDNEGYTYLLNFLSKLVKIYDQQKESDNSIKGFESTCNSYLIGKKVVYNESKVTINIIQDKTLFDIQLINLSSGEKQIISLFAKILFNQSKNIIVLFDEPELSLSIEWQKKILPDILKAKNCKLILSVTHSPFIFDNELDEYAQDINTYVSDIINPQIPETINRK